MILDLKSYLLRYKYKRDALYHALLDLIVQRKLSFQERLPSSRELALEYNLSRGLVTNVYEMLVADGYLSSHTGKGTFVSYRAPDTNRHPGSSKKTSPQSPIQKKTSIHLDFRLGRADIDAFPVRQWRFALSQAQKEYHRFMKTYATDIKGVYELRQAIANHVSRHRGFRTNANRVVILPGSQSAIQLLCQTLLKKGDYALLEDPCYTGIRRSVQSVGASFRGLGIEQTPARLSSKKYKLVFLTPGNQFPTTRTMPWKRRSEWLEWANVHRACIVEDDFDSEFRYKGIPLPSLKSMDSDERVIFMGSFSKSIGNFLRLGYVILPERWLDGFLQSKSLYEPFGSAILEQLTLAKFITNFDYERHLRKMTRLYKHKHDFLLTQLEQRLPTLFDWQKSEAGMHIFGHWLSTKEKYNKFYKKCLEVGLAWSDSDPYYIQKPVQKRIVLGFSHLSFEQIERGVALMAQIYKEL